MKIPSSRRSRGLKFNITPLIDIVFLLIIFFLVASHLARSQTAEAVELPEAVETEDDVEEHPHRLIITITSDRRFHVAGREVSSADVERMIATAAAEAAGKPFDVRIRGDRSVPYEMIEPILLACAKAGQSDLKFTVLKP